MSFQGLSQICQSKQLRWKRWWMKPCSSSNQAPGLVALDKLCLKTPIALWLSKPIWTPESKLAWFNTVASCCFWRLYHTRKVCFQHTWCLILAWVRNPNLDAMKTWWKRDFLSKDRLQLWVFHDRLLHSTRHFGGLVLLADLKSSSKVQKFFESCPSCPCFVQDSCDSGLDEGITALGLACVAIADEVGLMWERLVIFVISWSLRLLEHSPFRTFQRSTMIYWSEYLPFRILQVFTAVSTVEIFTALRSDQVGLSLAVAETLADALCATAQLFAAEDEESSPKDRNETRQRSESAKVKCLRTPVEKIMKDSSWRVNCIWIGFDSRAWKQRCFRCISQ